MPGRGPVVKLTLTIREAEELLSAVGDDPYPDRTDAAGRQAIEARRRAVRKLDNAIVATKATAISRIWGRK